MLIYDINLAQFVKNVDVNPNAANLQYIYMDDQGFNCFKICRSNELVDHSRTKKKNPGFSNYVV